MKVIEKILVAMLLVGFVFTACNKDDVEPTIGEVTVYDINGKVVPGASVRLYCTEPDCVIDQTKITNGSGVTRHEFFQPMVLAIEAIKLDTTVQDTGIPPNVGFIILIDSNYGEGFITIQKHQTSQEPVIVYPQ